jgi:hypothetical protein
LRLICLVFKPRNPHKAQKHAARILFLIGVKQL